tara:strand:- start:1672 stop:2016 length:345 start_codon:yes stop_codon:yes gene_type:complete
MKISRLDKSVFNRIDFLIIIKFLPQAYKKKCIAQIVYTVFNEIALFDSQFRSKYILPPYNKNVDIPKQEQTPSVNDALAEPLASRGLFKMFARSAAGRPWPIIFLKSRRATIMR